MSLYDYLPICLCVYTWQKINQAGGPETFLTLFALSNPLQFSLWDLILYMHVTFMLHD